jgi:hypothetical protein
MAALEEDLFEDLAYDEAEGVAAMEDELEMDDLAIDEFDEGYEDELEMEAYADEDYSDYDDAEDELEATEDYYDEFDSYDEFDEAGLDEAEDTFDSAMAFALGAEDADARPVVSTLRRSSWQGRGRIRSPQNCLMR